MATEANRVQMTVRLKAADKEFFAAGAESCGIEAGVAVRQILELVIQRMRSGGDFVDALHELKTTWRVPRQEELERRLNQSGKPLGDGR